MSVPATFSAAVVAALAAAPGPLDTWALRAALLRAGADVPASISGLRRRVVRLSSTGAVTIADPGGTRGPGQGKRRPALFSLPSSTSHAD